MISRKFSVFLSTFSYGGNGGFKSEHPAVGLWVGKVFSKCKQDLRIHDVMHNDWADTPITMCRNDAVCTAREHGADFLLMIDSDMIPDCEPGEKKFWTSSFDFAVKHYDKGPCAVFAPYGGPPPDSPPYVFKWAGGEQGQPGYKLTLMEHSEAAMWSGITGIAAAPTGLSLYDLRCFDLIEPPYFKYEFSDKYERKKSSTEDVFNTRDISLNGMLKLGYNPIYCNWDCWAAHYKPWYVRKPRPLTVDNVADSLIEVVKQNIQPNERIMEIGELTRQERPDSAGPFVLPASDGPLPGERIWSIRPDGQWQSRTVEVFGANRQPVSICSITVTTDVQVGTPGCRDV